MENPREEEENIESIYDGEGRETLTDNDEISPEEEAFMKGYDEDEEKEEKERKGDKAYEEAFEE